MHGRDIHFPESSMGLTAYHNTTHPRLLAFHRGFILPPEPEPEAPFFLPNSDNQLQAEEGTQRGHEPLGGGSNKGSAPNCRWIGECPPPCLGAHSCQLSVFFLLSKAASIPSSHEFYHGAIYTCPASALPCTKRGCAASLGCWSCRVGRSPLCHTRDKGPGDWEECHMRP